MSSNRCYQEEMKAQKETQQATVQALNAPDPQQSKNKRKFSSMLDFVNKQARLEHSSGATASREKNPQNKQARLGHSLGESRETNPQC